MEKLSRAKQSSSLRIFVNYGHKKFYNIGPWSEAVPFHPSLIFAGKGVSLLIEWGSVIVTKVGSKCRNVRDPK